MILNFLGSSHMYCLFEFLKKMTNSWLNIKITFCGKPVIKIQDTVRHNKEKLKSELPL